MRCLPGSLSSRTARWLFYSHTSPRGGDTHTCLNSSGVISPRACSLPAARKPELACRDTERRALGGKNPNILNLSKKEIFLKDKAMLPAEKKRSGVAGDAGNESGNNQQQQPHAVAPRALGAGPAPAPGEVWLFPLTRAEDPPQQQQHRLLALAQAALSTFRSQKNRLVKKTQTTQGSLPPFPRHSRGQAGVTSL